MNQIILNIEDDEEEVYSFSNFELVYYPSKVVDVLTEEDFVAVDNVDTFITVKKIEDSYFLIAGNVNLLISEEDYILMLDFLKEKGLAN